MRISDWSSDVCSSDLAAADLVFADGPQTAAQLFDAARDGALKGFALPGTITLASRSRIEPLESRNAVAKIAGRDAALGAAHVVTSADPDHIRIGAPVARETLSHRGLDHATGASNNT